MIIYTAVSVSMDLNDYQHLILKSNKIHIKFLDNETQTEIEKIVLKILMQIS